MRISELMTKDVATVAVDQTLRDVVNLMRLKKIRHVPVVEGSALVGIVTDRDVKRALPSVFSGDQDEFERVLSDTRVDQVMTRDPFTLRPTDSVKDALKALIERKFGGIPIVNNGKVVGIVTDIDFLRAFEKTLR